MASTRREADGTQAPGRWMSALLAATRAARNTPRASRGLTGYGLSALTPSRLPRVPGPAKPVREGSGERNARPSSRGTRAAPPAFDAVAAQRRAAGPSNGLRPPGLKPAPFRMWGPEGLHSTAPRPVAGLPARPGVRAHGLAVRLQAVNDAAHGVARYWQPAPASVSTKRPALPVRGSILARNGMPPRRHAGRTWRPRRPPRSTGRRGAPWRAFPRSSPGPSVPSGPRLPHATRTGASGNESCSRARQSGVT